MHLFDPSALSRHRPPKQIKLLLVFFRFRIFLSYFEICFHSKIIFLPRLSAKTLSQGVFFKKNIHVGKIYFSLHCVHALVCFLENKKKTPHSHYLRYNQSKALASLFLRYYFTYSGRVYNIYSY